MQSVSILIVSPDGNTVATAGDRYVQVWDRSLKTRLTIMSGHTKPISCITYSPDGKYIASGSDDCTVRIWDAKTGENVCLLRLMGWAGRIQYSPDGKFLFSSNWGTYGIDVWDVNTQAKVRKIRCTTSAKNFFALSPDGKYLARNEERADMYIRDTDTGKAKAILHSSGNKSIVWIAYAPDGKRLAAASGDEMVRVWDLNTLEGELGCKTTLSGHTGWVIQVMWTKNGHYLVSACTEILMVWDAQTFECVSRICIQVSSLVFPNLFWYRKGKEVVLEEIPFLSFQEILMSYLSKGEQPLSDSRVWHKIFQYL